MMDLTGPWLGVSLIDLSPRTGLSPILFGWLLLMLPRGLA
jgi:hypothetical protein